MDKSHKNKVKTGTNALILEIFFVAGEQNSDFFIQNAAMV
jgi:hypothetical protein